MNDQYYTADPQSESRPVGCEFTWRGHSMKFTTDAGVFSKGELDAGTRILLDALPETMTGDILDIGCGWGPIGICVKKHWPATRVMMGDVNRRALHLTEENAVKNGVEVTCRESDGLAEFMEARFDAVITNPPIRAGKQTIYKMFADSAQCLKENGALYLVIRKQQGADSCMKYLKTIFAEVGILDRSGGFRVLKAYGKKNAEA
ncbi:MAG: methyltransferase [Clostridia bacterium]|nr:methyltransferase [Clostridia bacterium]